MKKTFLLLFLFLGLALADNFPSFPMSIYGNIKIGTTDISAGNVKVYDGSNNELSNYIINNFGKYGAETATDIALTLNEFSGNITIKVIYNGTTYTVTQDQIDDTNRGDGCPSKSGISFVSKNCRYDITLTQQSGGGGGGGGGGWGGGGATIIETPNISTGNNNTGNNHTGTNQTTQEENTQNPQQTTNKYSQEFNNAYTYAYSIGITTMPSIQEANLEGNLIRSHMSKMMVNYAVKVIGLTGDQNKECNFNDIQDQSEEMKYYIKLSCQLGIMRVGVNNFNPNGIVTRAEFGTVLSRILYGDKYNGGNPYYVNHLKALKDNGIITNDNPSLEELRGYVMLMLMRSDQ